MTATLAGLEVPPTITVDDQSYFTSGLLSADAIQSRVTGMGQDLAEHYAGRGELHVLTVMNGAQHFSSDLRRAIQAADPDLALTSDIVKMSSYTGTRSSGVVRFEVPPSQDVEGRHVLVAEDILDSGLTLSWLSNYLRGQNAASLEVAVAFDKHNPSRRNSLLSQTAMHIGFQIPNAFVIGYGLDLNQRWRDLGGLHTLTALPKAEI